MPEHPEQALFELIRETPGLLLDSGLAALGRANSDFGRVVTGRSLAVARPRSTQEVLQLVKAASLVGARLTPRGFGLSQSGQSVAKDSVTVDLGEICEVDEPNTLTRTIACGAGASWRAVVERAVSKRLIPKVMPLNLDLSIGGTLSAGGFGSTSHAMGLAVSHIAGAQVVTGAGEIVECSPHDHRPVYDTVFGGLGRCAVITRVELGLRPLMDHVRTCFLRYETVRELLIAQAALLNSARADHVEGFCSATVHGFRKDQSGRRVPLVRWQFGLQVSREYAATPPSVDELTEGLRPAEVLLVEDDDSLGFARRYDGRFQMMRAIGAWEKPHPWFELLLPPGTAESYLSSALEHVPVFLGDMHRIMLIANTARPTAVAFPDHSEAFAVGFAVLPVGVEPALRDMSMAAMQRLHALGLEAGGKRYTSGWLPGMTVDDWKAHYGAAYADLASNQRALDPKAVFTSALGGLV